MTRGLRQHLVNLWTCNLSIIMELENTSRAGCLQLPGDTKPLSLALLCEFPRVMMVQSVSTSLGQAPSCLSSEQEMGYPHSPLMVVCPGCWSDSPTDQSILKEATVSFNIFLIYKAIVHSVRKSYTYMCYEWLSDGTFFPFDNKENVKIRCVNYFGKIFQHFLKITSM